MYAYEGSRLVGAGRVMQATVTVQTTKGYLRAAVLHCPLWISVTKTRLGDGQKLGVRNGKERKAYFTYPSFPFFRSALNTETD